MPRSPSTSLPPYLTSGASSRTHHGLLVKLHEAASAQEEDELISNEITKAKAVLSSKGQSTSKISDTLIVLLHCQILRHRVEDNVEFALVSALQLAEGGRSLSERRIGYLYLVESLPKGHELNLLLINTIRKDLSSSTTSHILLALQTIIKIPSTDLGPAVIPLLTSKHLWRHKLPVIRQRTFQALLSLHRILLNEPFPLSINKLLKAISSESDISVLNILFRTSRHVLETGAHHIANKEERLYVLEKILDAARQNNLSHGSQISLEILKLLKVIMGVKEGSSSEVIDAAQGWITDQLNNLSSYRGLNGAFLMEICHLANIVSSISSHILRHISHLLLPDLNSPSSSTSIRTLPPANDHALALRCLQVIPTSLWDGILGEREMAIIMEGVDSIDGTIRKLTIRLLYNLDLNLPSMVFQKHIESIKTSTELSLPLYLSTSLSIEDKTTIGRYETASRALEVVEITCREDGREYAKGLLEVLDVLNVRTSGVWDEGVRCQLDNFSHLPQATTERIVASFVNSILTKGDRKPGDTTLVILTSTICEFLPPSYNNILRTIRYLSSILPGLNGSIQELVLVTLVSLLSISQESEQESCQESVLETVRTVQRDSSRYIQRRCTEIITILEKRLVNEVTKISRSRKLADVLEAISLVHTRYSKISTTSQTSSPTPAPPPRADLSASQLRYDAYQSPRGRAGVNNRYRDHFDEDSE
ncbi:uncharacterized protein IL334_002199 [Kwoniella shivajii]|uniref:Clathrin/coatomer adaptor adaptin-like N-terminal domain-containing protein n=1 Tax=Kwoniella shivajii TaxID=564305 RepID=A0ABZ1CX33_9TREE|nr:hypothetical protein IL334_002199 [Kwoniella shivajii]